MDDKPHRAEPAWPIVGVKDHKAPSVFRPESLLREARRQRQLPLVAVPEICVLDPDGDVVRHLKRTGAGRIHEGWACYHTELLAFDLGDIGEVGIVGCAVGAPFAVLVAEQLFASGCRLLVSVTSAGQINPIGPTPYFVLIDRALRDEGTSYHYLPGSTFAAAPDMSLLDRVEQAGRSLPEKLHRGLTWTTDAPYRETEAAISRARDLGTLAVEMEAAALYAFGARFRRDERQLDRLLRSRHKLDGADRGRLREGRGRRRQGNPCCRCSRRVRLAKSSAMTGLGHVAEAHLTTFDLIISVC